MGHLPLDSCLRVRGMPCSLMYGFGLFARRVLAVNLWGLGGPRSWGRDMRGLGCGHLIHSCSAEHVDGHTTAVTCTLLSYHHF